MSTAKERKAAQRAKARYKALSLRITIEQVSEFDQKLVPVTYGYGTCWLYPSKSVGGDSKSYGRMWHNGFPVMAHRFALAVKLGCTLWEIEDYQAGHAPKSVCVGYRCCNPDHLFRQTATRNRYQQWQDAKQFGQRELSKQEQRERIAAMYPNGMTVDGNLFDEPWQSNTSPELLRFMEMGLKTDLEAMQQNRVNLLEAQADTR